jgi:FlaG/FlaF family flagellin (archaellin)
MRTLAILLVAVAIVLAALIMTGTFEGDGRCDEIANSECWVLPGLD